MTGQSEAVPYTGVAVLMGERPASFVLSIVSGFVDTAGFIALFGLFTAHVTGNLVLAGAAIVKANESGIVSRLAMLPVFMLTVALTTLLVRLASHRLWDAPTLLLAIETLALALFLLVGVVFGPRLDNQDQQGIIILIGGTGVVAMGIQNTLMREVLGHMLPTTIMTGNFTQLTIDLTQITWLWSHRRGEHERSEVHQLQTRLARSATVVVGFVLGATCGAFGIAHLRFWCLIFPTLAIGLLTVAAYTQYRQRLHVRMNVLSQPS